MQAPGWDAQRDPHPFLYVLHELDFLNFAPWEPLKCDEALATPPLLA